MVAIVASRVAYAHVDAEPLFAGVDLHLVPGWVGIVGETGAGKTTLVRLLAGEIAPREGAVRRDPADGRVLVCPQVVAASDEEVRAFARDDGGAARAMRGRLELDPAGLARWATLSPGERKRWQIGAALAANPAALFLDEPTNHLDGAARTLLLAALRRFRGIGVLVSHDRELLDTLTTSTVRVRPGAVTCHPGSYTDARADWERDAGAREAKRQILSDAARAAQRHHVAQRTEWAGAARDLSARHRMKGPRDHDATGLLANYRVEQAEARLARRVAVARASASRAAAAVPAFEVDPALGRSVFIDYAPPPRARLLSFDDALRIGERTLLTDVHVAVERGARLRVTGPNGAGKTTLVEAMLCAAALPPERVLHVRQEMEPEAGRAALEALRALPPGARGRTLQLVAALGVNPERLLASRDPSPGEARKLVIAGGLARHVWLAVLDEPTNHLDLPSIERLERALAAFPGALVVVTHDPTFLADACPEGLHVEGGRVTPRSGRFEVNHRS